MKRKKTHILMFVVPLFFFLAMGYVTFYAFLRPSHRTPLDTTKLYDYHP